MNALYQKSLQENPQLAATRCPAGSRNSRSRSSTPPPNGPHSPAGAPPVPPKKTGKAAKTVKEKAQQAGAYVMRHKKGFGIARGDFPLVCLLLNTMSSLLHDGAEHRFDDLGTTYPSDDPELVAVEADYAAKEAALQAEIDNIESSHPGYDEYRYDLDMIGHDPHELAAYLSASCRATRGQAPRRSWNASSQPNTWLTLTEEVEVRYRTETRTDSEGQQYDRGGAL